MMLSLRALARSTPRAIGRVSAAPSLRQLTARPKTLGAVSSAVNTASRPCYAAFSTTVRRPDVQKKEMDQELASTLQSECQIEEELKDAEMQPAGIKDFLDNTPYKLIDEPGREAVKLVRKFDDEKITVSFSIADITDYDPFGDEYVTDEDYTEPSMQDANQQEEEPNMAPSRPNLQAVPEPVNVANDDPNTASIRLTVVVEKPGKSKGALVIEASSIEDEISVQNVFYYEDATAAQTDCADANAKRLGNYPGPPFSTLDDDLQRLISRYLQERGINDTLALFITEYIEVKEQAEYMRWLNNVKTFVDL